MAAPGPAPPGAHLPVSPFPSSWAPGRRHLRGAEAAWLAGFLVDLGSSWDPGRSQSSRTVPASPLTFSLLWGFPGKA